MEPRSGVVVNMFQIYLFEIFFCSYPLILDAPESDYAKWCIIGAL
jgi:hypothetical protein